MSGKGDVKAQKQRYRVKHREALYAKHKLWYEATKNDMVICALCGLSIIQGNKSHHMQTHKP